MPQRYKKYDLVFISKELDLNRNHITSGCKAIILGSYTDLYPMQLINQPYIPIYKLYIEKEGPVSWYGEDELSFLESNQEKLLQQWESAREKDIQENLI